jgi:hypothetical protein
VVAIEKRNSVDSARNRTQIPRRNNFLGKRVVRFYYVGTMIFSVGRKMLQVADHDPNNLTN